MIIMIFISNLHMPNSSQPGIILCMRTTNERRRYIVTSSLIGWVHIYRKWSLHNITKTKHELKMYDCGSLRGLLTHWGRVTHICVSKLTIIGSDNGLLPGWRQAIISTNARILLIGPLGTKLNQNSYIFAQENAFEIVVWKMMAILSRPQCVNSLRPSDAYMHRWTNHPWFR